MTRAIDCDVHCTPGTWRALAPHLSTHWRSFLSETGFVAPVGATLTYPAWSNLLAIPASSPEKVANDVLATTRAAILHCYFGVESMSHPYLPVALAEAVNRWIEADWLAHDERFHASIVVTPQDPDAAAAEIRRAASANPRFVSVLLPVRAAVGYGARRYWPVWETALEYDLPIALTYGGSPGTPPSPVGWLDSSFEEYGSATSHYQAQVASLVMSGVFEKLPELRVVLLESGWTWLPSLFWRMDREWKGLRREVPWMTDLPSAYARKHFRLTTSPTDAPESRTYVDELVDQLGSAEILMFGSDYPHHYPAEDEFLARITSAGIADEVMWANAERCFPRISRAV